MNRQSQQPCPTNSQISQAELKDDSGCVMTAQETFHNGLPKKAVKETTSTKCKAEVRAERRALQVGNNFVFVQ